MLNALIFIALPYASIVKLDLSEFERPAFTRQVESLRRHPVVLVAERVETESEFAECRALGCHYFQGFFFAHPKVLEGSRAPAGRMTAIRVLACACVCSRERAAVPRPAAAQSRAGACPLRRCACSHVLACASVCSR